MSKQKELEELRELHEHFIAIEEIDKQILKKDDAFERAVCKEAQRRMPQPPQKTDFSVGANQPEKKSKCVYPYILFVCTFTGIIAHFVYFGVSLSFFNDPYLLMFVLFHIGYYFFLRKESGLAFFGMIFSAIFSIGTLLLSMFTSYSLFLLAIQIFSFTMVTVISSREEKAQKKIAMNAAIANANANQEYEKAVKRHEMLRTRTENAVRNELIAEFRLQKEAFQRQRTERQDAITSSTILHPDYKKIDIITYLIHRMEHGEADSIKEALQIKRTEDLKRESDMANFRVKLEIQNMQRQEDERRRWQEQREQWTRDMAHADRERERMDQAKRAADELERIRKELENN